ncbi:hypothetical protein [Flavobacterium sp. XGLA_31]|uniref:hypothetical protein n=1 Tax=Flavobacterium sp. XGLA_31 TaxID=3447666 RepID=UPI003F30BDEC
MALNNKINNISTVFDFLKKQWIVVLAIIVFFVVGLPILRRWSRNQTVKNAVNENDNASTEQYVNNLNPVTSQVTADSITKRKDIQTASTAIANVFRTKFDNNSWTYYLNPTNWFEWGEEEAFNYLMYQRYNFHLLEQLYYYVDTPRRNLKNDCLDYLTTAQVQKLQQLNIL